MQSVIFPLICFRFLFNHSHHIDVFLNFSYSTAFPVNSKNHQFNVLDSSTPIPTIPRVCRRRNALHEAVDPGTGPGVAPRPRPPDPVTCTSRPRVLAFWADKNSRLLCGNNFGKIFRDFFIPKTITLIFFVSHTYRSIYMHYQGDPRTLKFPVPKRSAP